MPSIRDLFPERWLKASHLISDGRRRSVTVTIVGAQVEQLFNPRTKRNEPRLTVEFYGKKLRLVCNKTQAWGIMMATSTDDYTAWKGHMITLSVGTAPNGADTIIVTAPPAAQPPSAVTVAGAVDEDEDEEIDSPTGGHSERSQE
jgi:hypothetical protein